MDAFLGFFETMPIWQKLIWLVAIITLFWILEGYYPFRKATYKKWKHARTNLTLLSFTMVINTVFGIATVGVFLWKQEASFGILHWFEAPVWVELGIALLLLDLIAQYGVHYFLHKNKWLWHLHTVHHSDTHLDVTSGTRHHPMDFIMRELAALFTVVITGMPISFYLLYRIITIFFTYWTHTSFGVPEKIDRALSYMIVTPGMHRFHHHREMSWTDTNFGNILSIWDRLFGTFLYDDPSKVKFGLDIIDETQTDTLNYQLGLPFDKRVTYKK
jgi:sterol desaturase/sphingolipid hydroxylase (fatty acid hydroxylase superfamily)